MCSSGFRCLVYSFGLQPTKLQAVVWHIFQQCVPAATYGSCVAVLAGWSKMIRDFGRWRSGEFTKLETGNWASYGWYGYRTCAVALQFASIHPCVDGACLAPFRRARAAAAVVKHLLGSYVTWESSSQIDLKTPNTRLIFNHPLEMTSLTTSSDCCINEHLLQIQYSQRQLAPSATFPTHK